MHEEIIDFRKFINEQDDERAIDQKGGWSECAIGDFLVEKRDYKRENRTACESHIYSELRKYKAINHTGIGRSNVLNAISHCRNYGDAKIVINSRFSKQ